MPENATITSNAFHRVSVTNNYYNPVTFRVEYKMQMYLYDINYQPGIIRENNADDTSVTLMPGATKTWPADISVTTLLHLGSWDAVAGAGIEPWSSGMWVIAPDHTHSFSR